MKKERGVGEREREVGERGEKWRERRMEETGRKEREVERENHDNKQKLSSASILTAWERSNIIKLEIGLTIQNLVCHNDTKFWIVK